MTWKRRIFLLIVTVLLIAAAASIGLAYPTPVADPALGSEWQCQRSAFVATCHRTGRAV